MTEGGGPLVVILMGVSGVGKTTIARELARQLDAVHIRIDSIEQAVRESGVTVVSLDDTAKKAFSSATPDVQILTGIVWVNPDKPSEDVPAWLRAGAPDEAHRELGAE